MLRRPAAVVAAALVVVPLLLTLPGCGSGNGQLQVSLSGDAGSSYKSSDQATYAQYKPGGQATFTVDVVNAGPGSVTGVTVHVILPGSFHYHATTSISAPGSTRTQPLDAAAKTSAPIFGLWTIAAPGTAGPNHPSGVAITFTADVGGLPGTATVQASAAGDASAGETDAAPYNVLVNAAARLSALVSVNPTTVKRGDPVIYEVRIINDGTGNAKDVGVLITLPPVMTFTSSVTPFAGNGSRNKGVDPIKNTLEVYYDGFLLPPISNGGPGFVVIVFKATAVAPGRVGSTLEPTAAVPAGSPTPATGFPTGTYTVDANVTDDSGDTFTLHAVAPVTVT